MNNREYFNSIAEKWDSIAKHDINKIEKILRMVKLEEGCRVLDVGTGTGIMIPFLHSYIGNTGEIIAVDIAENMIEVARKKYNFKNVKFIAEDVLKIDFSENFFDCIMCYSMFPHFDNKKAAVEKLAKYLKKDGKFVICHSQSRESINNLHKGLSDPVQNDRLPDANQIAKCFDGALIRTTTIVDNDEMYVLIGTKM